ncbi:16S rRNA (guanine(527)-N(7))-methyltransferase RsmG [Nioella nitratireducens]|uniref:16S rRNA (guanine(527)-N(7))-methyltransferase RsmG n=1 Tax=Nioella nitratireducens TaxID=1287720 RepID=UPI0008FD7D00|nr:16S rRNA (guanine(527)-N(7))-methyltransferase RsmG [Nioella nitratireducens]
MTEDDARARLQASVSRETFDRLQTYADALVKWQKAINLVAPSTIPELWSRHFLDSAQVFDLCPVKEGLWLDIGSGAGFPGLVCAAVAAEQAPELRFTFIESDLRKGSFLRTVAAEMGLKVGVLTRRIEEAPPQGAAVLSARALASLGKLLGHAERHLSPNGTALFLKGATHAQEIEEALETWRMSVDSVSSQTAEGAVILKIGDIHRA